MPAIDNTFDDNCYESNNNNNNNMNDCSKMSSSEPKVMTILHFNDCYNVEPRNEEPSGGAARMVTAFNTFKDLNPLVLFSGDIIAPSIMSTFAKGEQMIPVVKALDIDCAIYGNHEFDFGVDNLLSFVKQTSFPWLMSNVFDNETNRPLGDGKIWHIIDKSDIKFGIIGLIEEEWLATLATLALEDVTYIDFVTEGRKLAKLLKEKENVDFVIALTHMRFPNDCRLAENVDEIDLILGGHDHDYEVKLVNGKYIIKSGTDFRQFSRIDITFKGQSFDISIKEINVNSYDFEEEKSLKAELEKYSDIIEGKMDSVLGHISCDLDGRFASIRTKETNLGNLVADIMLASTHSDLAILNSGTLRSDQIHSKGPFLLRDLVTIMPMMDPLIVLNATGHQIWKALENGVSQWPRLEGRFPQVAGIKFAFNPSKPPGSRINAKYMKIGDEYLDLNQKYRLVTKGYLAQGKDGYDILKECQVLQKEDECPEMVTSVQNHFESIKILTGNTRKTNHRQSLVCLSRRTSVVKMHDIGSLDLNSMTQSFHETRHDNTQLRGQLKKVMSLDGRRSTLTRCPSFENIEYEYCKLEPKVEGRIIILTEEILQRLEKEKQEFISSNILEDPIPEEDNEVEESACD
ncbi:trifunctional nucleotide phosphoesterase protein YfkN-like [Oppia nitens]|uniref:trifunctional nucleotide phosphoesterase protein YfkN-like n=1 Tax=Oppia nitens TaxID=1686743 RepID=UPI0023DACA9D|nr:trifunctional nucleotide phosphoesterase protein YfkN-like [Oppia nitens]